MTTIYPRISNTVGKLGVGIGTVNLPAIQSCRSDAPCKKGCYACKGNFSYPKVKTSLQKNLDAYVEDPDRFFNVLHNQLEMIPYRFFRWFSAGDIYDTRFLEGMCCLARKHKGTQFLCFTKKYELVNEYYVNVLNSDSLALLVVLWASFRLS